MAQAEVLILGPDQGFMKKVWITEGTSRPSLWCFGLAALCLACMFAAHLVQRWFYSEQSTKASKQSHRSPRSKFSRILSHTEKDAPSCVQMSRK